MKTHSLIATILVGESSLDMSFTPDGKTAYVVNSRDFPNDGIISVVDVKTHQVIATDLDYNTANIAIFEFFEAWYNRKR
ncbi:YncE family protein [Cytobacillus sp. Hm23]